MSFKRLIFSEVTPSPLHWTVQLPDNARATWSAYGRRSKRHFRGCILGGIFGSRELGDMNHILVECIHKHTDAQEAYLCGAALFGMMCDRVVQDHTKSDYNLSFCNKLRELKS